MQLFLVQGVGSVLVLLTFVWFASGGRNPGKAVFSALQRARASHSGRRAMLAISTVIAINYIEGLVDPALSRWLGWDATRIVHAIESDFVGRLQAVTPHALLAPLALVYVPGYLALLGAPLVLWSSPNDRSVAGRYILAFVLNYVVALPFFLFVPVREVGWSGLSTAQPLLETVWSGITEQLRAGSPVDNCFPSMHVSCVVTTLWYVHGHGPLRLKYLTWAMVPAIIWSTMALGIHWVSDVVAGVIVGIGCSLATDRRGNIFVPTTRP